MQTFWEPSANSGCLQCGLNKKVNSPCIPPYGLFKKKIMIVGEGPGGEEDKYNEPFKDKAGQLLRSALTELGIDIYNDCITINSINCRPTKQGKKGLENRTPTDNEIKLCRPIVISAIRKYKPKLIILLGWVACKSVLLDSEISKLHGEVIPDRVFNCWIAPTSHPSRILREENWDVYIGELWMRELKNALSYIDEPFPDIPIIYTVAQTIKEVEAEIDKCFQNRFAFLDYENYPLKPFNNDSELICGALTSDGTATVFPIENYWSEKDFKRLQGGLHDLVTSPDVDKGSFNIKHERMWTIKRFGFDFKPPYYDPMLKKYALDERNKTNGLKHLVWMLFGDRDYEKVVNRYKTDMRKCPPNLRNEYCAKDAIYGFHIEIIMDERLKAEPAIRQNVYEDLLMVGTEASLESEMLGTLIDTDIMQELDNEFEKEITDITSEIYSMPEVKKYMKQDIYFDISKNQRVESFLYDFCKITPLKETKTRRSVDNEVLEAIDIDFTRKLLKVRELTKLRDFTGPNMISNIYDDGRFHTSYNFVATVTGRPASSDPNLQQIPRRKHPEIRKMFVAPPDHVMIKNDYSQWEVRGSQMYCKDPKLGHAIWNNIDFHGEYATIIFGTTIEKDGKEEFKKKRDISKNKFIFPTIYGAKASSVAGYLGLPVEYIEPIQKRFLEEYHYLHEWQMKLVHDYEKDGYIENLFGRRRRAPLPYNKLINSPIQSLCVDFLIKAWKRCEDDKIQIPLEVHDDLTAYALLKYWDDVYYQIKKNMTEWDYEWINVPIEIESKVGEDWYETYNVEELLK